MNTWIETHWDEDPDALQNRRYTFTTPNDLAHAMVAQVKAGGSWRAHITWRRDWSTKEGDFADLEQAKAWCEEIIAQL